MATSLKLYNTLTRDKVDFAPIDADNVRMYVCGPTVYDFAHIGNARPVIVFDVLYRLLRHVYGESHVTYVRNITDVDDKINARALRDFGAQIADGSMTLNEAIRAVTGKTESQFHADVAALGCLQPTVEPRATDNIGEMIAIIQRLLDQGHAYVATGSEGHEVLFATASMADYGQLSKRKLEDQQAGARVAVEAHKTNPGDFVLWKQSADTEPGWSASFTFEGKTVAIHGRPGWHIECSAMADRYLWEDIKDRLSPRAKASPHQFDIHGGGLDLIFPHHENEIAQSCCAFDTDIMANVWMHNGFVQVEGRKMSKSEGNFVTINELLETDKFGGRKWPGEVLRLAMLMTHYREPIDFSVKRLEEAERLLAKWPVADAGDAEPDAAIIDALADELNTVAAVQALHALAQAANADPSKAGAFAASAALLGIVPKKAALSDDLAAAVEALVAMRLEMLKTKNFTEADKIRDDLLAKGIQLKDGKDKESGERVTTWEVKR
ncbi:MAG: cysteine--tRNA ligase [Alphaproteobacteria bacterium]|nr:cysteine--tRNA ligase [Rhizobiaceae bacterium]MBU3960883.1 cysteine--tRNA ligase [Alphaproteobacteria bacterium]MBU4050110.1 cysteine--tRNA ligase [Alphaproteobacteria bacterium]MBU4091500.1 cysteine--tRNA ligase [Alphaproteobacteria bacterium]MBU4158042.1 cysteine--tRNA ligase [Alphaproteobacteria bacterium]